MSRPSASQRYRCHVSANLGRCVYTPGSACGLSRPRGSVFTFAQSPNPRRREVAAGLLDRNSSSSSLRSRLRATVPDGPNAGLVKQTAARRDRRFPRAPATAVPGSTRAARLSPPRPWTERWPDGASPLSGIGPGGARPPSPIRPRGLLRPLRARRPSPEPESAPSIQPPRRGEPLIAPLDGYVVGRYRASHTCQPCQPPRPWSPSRRRRASSGPGPGLRRTAVVGHSGR